MDIFRDNTYNILDNTDLIRTNTDTPQDKHKYISRQHRRINANKQHCYRTRRETGGKKRSVDKVPHVSEGAAISRTSSSITANRPVTPTWTELVTNGRVISIYPRVSGSVCHRGECQTSSPEMTAGRFRMFGNSIKEGIIDTFEKGERRDLLNVVSQLCWLTLSTSL